MASAQVPVLYIEEIDQDSVDWRVFIRHTNNGIYQVYGTRRPCYQPKEVSKFPSYRLEFRDKLSLYNWLSEVMCTRTNNVNLTLYMANRNVIKSSDFDNYYDNCRIGELELVGYDDEKLSKKTFFRYLNIISSTTTL